MKQMMDCNQCRELTVCQIHSFSKQNWTPKNVATCPVCGGNGLVMNGFYRQVGGAWTSSDTSFEMCRSCQGKGYVIVT